MLLAGFIKWTECSDYTTADGYTCAAMAGAGNAESNWEIFPYAYLGSEVKQWLLLKQDTNWVNMDYVNWAKSGNCLTSWCSNSSFLSPRDLNNQCAIARTCHGLNIYTETHSHRQ